VWPLRLRSEKQKITEVFQVMNDIASLAVPARLQHRSLDLIQPSIREGGGEARELGIMRRGLILFFTK